MSIPFYNNLNLNGNKINNITIENLDKAPISPSKGQLYFNTTDNNLYCYNGSKWEALNKSQGLDKITLSSTEPTNPTIGDLYFDANYATIYLRNSDHHWMQFRPNEIKSSKDYGGTTTSSDTFLINADRGVKIGDIIIAKLHRAPKEGTISFAVNSLGAQPGYDIAGRRLYNYQIPESKIVVLYISGFDWTSPVYVLNSSPYKASNTIEGLTKVLSNVDKTSFEPYEVASAQFIKSLTNRISTLENSGSDPNKNLQIKYIKGQGTSEKNPISFWEYSKGVFYFDDATFFYFYPNVAARNKGEYLWMPGPVLVMNERLGVGAYNIYTCIIGVEKHFSCLYNEYGGNVSQCCYNYRDLIRTDYIWENQIPDLNYFLADNSHGTALFTVGTTSKGKNILNYPKIECLGNKLEVDKFSLIIRQVSEQLWYQQIEAIIKNDQDKDQLVKVSRYERPTGGGWSDWEIDDPVRNFYYNSGSLDSNLISEFLDATYNNVTGYSQFQGYIGRPGDKSLKYCFEYYSNLYLTQGTIGKYDKGSALGSYSEYRNREEGEFSSINESSNVAIAYFRNAYTTGIKEVKTYIGSGGRFPSFDLINSTLTNKVEGDNDGELAIKIDFGRPIGSEQVQFDFIYNDDYKYTTPIFDITSGPAACFTGDTLIVTKQGLKPIEEINLDDSVKSFNNQTKTIEYKPVTKIYSHTCDNIYNIITENNIIKASWSHPFIIKNYQLQVKAKDLQIGDLLVTENNFIEIKDIQISSEPVDVYEILIKDNNNYYITENNILVGNEENILKEEI